MRILMLAQFYPPILGGEEQYTRSLSQELAARGHQVAVATLRQMGLPELEIDNGVRVYRIRGTLQRAGSLFSDPDRQHAPPFPDPELTSALARIVSRERPHIVHMHNWLGYQYLPLQLFGSAKLVASLHDMSMVCAKKNFMYRESPCTGPGAVKCFMCAADHYGTLKGTVTTLANLVMSTTERAMVDMFLPVSETAAIGNNLVGSRLPFEVMPNFLADSLYEPQPGYDEYLAGLPDREFVLFVGGFRRIKGIDILLEAYAHIKDAPPLVLVGYDSPDTPETFPDGVIVHKHWPHGAVMEAWRRSMLGVIPSTCMETFGLVALEAMAAGRPVVASRLGGLAEVVADGQTGILVEPGNPKALQAAIERLVESPELRARMGEAGRTRADMFRASVIVPRVEEVYQRLMHPQVSQLANRSERTAEPVLSCAPPRPTPADTSVVICAYSTDRWESLKAAVVSVREQRSAPLELIVVIDHNEQLFQLAAEGLAGAATVVASTEPPGISGARNCGIGLSRGSIVAFLDDDALATPDWLEVLTAAYTEPDVVGVGGSVDPLWLTARPSWFPDEFGWVVGCDYRGMPGRGPVRNMIGANMSFRRDVIQHIGGFANGVGEIGKTMLKCDDTEFCIRLRQRLPSAVLLYEPAANVRHRVPASRARWAYYCLRCFTEGQAKHQIARLVGRQAALESERAYVSRVLPAAVARELALSILKQDGSRILRAAAIITGLSLAGMGYVAAYAREWALGPLRMSPTRLGRSAT